MPILCISQARASHRMDMKSTCVGWHWPTAQDQQLTTTLLRPPLSSPLLLPISRQAPSASHWPQSPREEMSWAIIWGQRKPERPQPGGTQPRENWAIPESECFVSCCLYECAGPESLVNFLVWTLFEIVGSGRDTVLQWVLLKTLQLQDLIQRRAGKVPGC